MTLSKKNTKKRPLVTIILPFYNEQAIIEKNVLVLQKYLETINNAYRWDILIVNDGSSNQTEPLADSLTEIYNNLRATITLPIEI